MKTWFTLVISCVAVLVVFVAIIVRKRPSNDVLQEIGFGAPSGCICLASNIETYYSPADRNNNVSFHYLFKCNPAGFGDFSNRLVKAGSQFALQTPTHEAADMKKIKWWTPHNYGEIESFMLTLDTATNGMHLRGYFVFRDDSLLYMAGGFSKK